MKNRIVIYTALFGDYDKLQEPLTVESNCDYMCFTDNVHLKSKTWRIINVASNSEKLASNYMNRLYKMKPHLFLAEYEYSIYIDSNIQILSAVSDFISKYLNSHLIAAPLHPNRCCVYDEIEFTQKKEMISKEQQRRVVELYMKEGYPKNNGLNEMNLIIRKHNHKSLIKVMDMWWDMFNDYVQRDQLSFKYCCWFNRLDVNNMFESTRYINKYFLIFPHTKQVKETLLKRLKWKLKLIFITKILY